MFPTLPLRAAALIAALIIGATATAADLDTFRDRYPPASIDSVAKADAALADVGKARPQVETDYRTTARACMAGFLVNSCLQDARDLRRKRISQLEAVEVEANRYKRRDHADRLEADRAKKEADRAANAQADSAVRAKKRADYDDRQKSAKRSADQAARDQAARKPKGPVVKPKPRTDAEADAAQRAKNASDQAKKVQEATEHQAEIARRVEEKTKERAQRAAAKAEKDAKDAAAAAAAQQKR